MRRRHRVLPHSANNGQRPQGRRCNPDGAGNTEKDGGRGNQRQQQEKKNRSIIKSLTMTEKKKDNERKNAEDTKGGWGSTNPRTHTHTQNNER
jgi:hypothetical protein